MDLMIMEFLLATLPPAWNGSGLEEVPVSAVLVVLWGWWKWPRRHWSGQGGEEGVAVGLILVEGDNFLIRIAGGDGGKLGGG